MPERAIWSVGHSDRGPDELPALLRAHGIRAVADVRRHPRSRRFPHFSREALEERLRRADIEYRWYGATLGGLRASRPDSPHRALTEGFRGYAEHMGTDAFCAALDLLEAWGGQQPTALLCAEKLPAACHRSLIADALLLRGCTVLHILDHRQAEVHRLHPAARPDAALGLCYDRGTSQPLF